MLTNLVGIHATVICYCASIASSALTCCLTNRPTEGIYVLLRPMARPPSKKTNRSPRKSYSPRKQRAGSQQCNENTDDRRKPAKAPPHLQHLVAPPPPEVDENSPYYCKWQLSGPQRKKKLPGYLEQRYCYPSKKESSSNEMGSTVWTIYDDNGDELLQYRVFHVYWSSKRSGNRAASNSPCRPPKQRRTNLSTPPIADCTDASMEDVTKLKCASSSAKRPDSSPGKQLSHLAALAPDGQLSSFMPSSRARCCKSDDEHQLITPGSLDPVVTASSAMTSEHHAESTEELDSPDSCSSLWQSLKNPAVMDSWGDYLHLHQQHPPDWQSSFAAGSLKDSPPWLSLDIDTPITAAAAAVQFGAMLDTATSQIEHQVDGKEERAQQVHEWARLLQQESKLLAIPKTSNEEVVSCGASSVPVVYSANIKSVLPVREALTATSATRIERSNSIDHELPLVTLAASHETCSNGADSSESEAAMEV